MLLLHHDNIRDGYVYYRGRRTHWPAIRSMIRGPAASRLAAAVARKIGRKPLKRLIPRPGFPRPGGSAGLSALKAGFETRRFPLLLG